MSYIPPRFRAKQSKKCWCGSGRKQKNCHGDKQAQEVIPDKIPAGTPSVNISSKPWGVPGEEHMLWVVPRFKGQSSQPAPGEIGGKHGNYKVQFLLSRPGYPITMEKEHKFIDDVIGDSHIAVTKPLTERRPQDVDRLQLQMAGKNFTFIGLPNERGFLGKIVVEELFAMNAENAENEAYEALAPFLSAWSLHLDIPVHIETIQVTEMASHINVLRVKTPHFDMAFTSGTTPGLNQEFCHYASLYREALNSNSSFYRFLCFYKIIESVVYRRSRLDHDKKLAGQEIRRIPQCFPNSAEGFKDILKEIYPWRVEWDEMAVSQMFPKEVWGKKLTYIRDHCLNPLRIGIAHALVKTGEVRITLNRRDHIQQVNKWLPLCRISARLMLREEFPNEFKMKSV